MLRRAGSLAAFAALALATPALVFRGVDALGVRDAEVALDTLDALQGGLAGLRAREAGPDSWQVGFLGDSMIVAYPPGKRVPDRLQQMLDSPDGATGRVRVHSLAIPGMGPFDYYFLSDLVADAAPDQVILPVNLSAFSTSWQESFARPQLAGWIPPARLPEALALPLDWTGLTADRLLSYVALVQLGATEPWHALTRRQARVGGMRQQIGGVLSERLAGGADARFGRAVFAYHEARLVLPGPPQRPSAEGIRERYGRALAGVGADDPNLRVLAAAIRVFRERGIEVLVYANPTNVEHVAALAAGRGEGLARTLDALARVSTSAGAGFADLHALLPDAGFRDSGGHLSAGGDVDGPQILARRLAPLLVESRRRARGARD